MCLKVLRVLLDGVTVKSETASGVVYTMTKYFGLHHPPITPPEKRKVPHSMRPHQTLTTLLQKISVV